MSVKTPLQVTVTRQIAASPDRLYRLITDIPQMPTFSPETIAAQWVKGSTGPAVGARFRGKNAIGRMRWTTTSTISRAEPGKVFAFEVGGPSRTSWIYDFTATDGGTLVTESMSRPSRQPLPIRLMQRAAGVIDREAHLRAGIITTLERLAAVAEAADREAISPR